MLVQVTWEDILLGTPKNGRCCPFARAARRLLPGDVRVSRASIIKFGSGCFQAWSLNEEARTFVIEFDLGHPVSPQVFDITHERNFAGYFDPD